jgi:hypothetical protein
MSKSTPSQTLSVSKKGAFRRNGLRSVLLGAVAIAMCELPILLAAIGLGGPGAGFASLGLGQYLEIGGAIIVMFGMSMIVIAWAANRRRERGA